MLHCFMLTYLYYIYPNDERQVAYTVPLYDVKYMLPVDIPLMYQDIS